MQSLKDQFLNSHIFFAVKRFKKLFFVLLLVSSITNLLMLTPTLYMLQIFDRVMISKSTFTLFAVSGLTVFLYAIQALAEWTRTHFLIQIGIGLDKVIGEKAFHAAFKDQLHNPNDNPGQVFTDMTVIRQWLTGPGIYAFFDLPWTPIYMLVMFVLHPALGYVTIAFMVILGFIAYLNRVYLKNLSDQTVEEERDLNNFIYAKLKNAEVIEAHGMVPNLMNRWWVKQSSMLNLIANSKQTEEKINSFSHNLRIFIQSLALAVGAILAIENQITVGAMIAATLLIGRATSPIDGIIQGWRNLENVKDSFSRIEQLFQKFDVAKGQSKKSISGKLSIENLSYRVENRDRPILDQINLDMPAGLVYGVIGPSGAGKSSLGRAMLGILPGATGVVELDEIRLGDFDREVLGAQLGYLPQSIELFSGSVAQNIARMNEIDSEKVIRAATLAGVHDLVLHFEKGYDTQIGVMGGYLSGGQRQRIALARAIYGMPKLIVLDEPNANLDDAGSQALLHAVQSMKNSGCSVVLITHRPDILKITDRVIYMNEGRIKLYETRDSFFERTKKQAQ